MELYRCDQCGHLFTPGYSGCSKLTFDIKQSQIPPVHTTKQYDLCKKCTDSMLLLCNNEEKISEELIYGGNSVL